MDQDDHITTLMSMGFENVEEIKKALRLGKNDINEAVAILTNEQDFNVMSNYDVKHDANNRALVPTVAPPPYDTYPDTEPPKASGCTSPQHGGASEISIEFPATHLYELEQRVFTERWSIPYKKEESLGKCLISAKFIADGGYCEADENCRRFLEYCMPEAFKKLLTSVAVRGWGLEVHEGVRNMLNLFINLAVARLKYDPVPISVLQVLERVFDPDSEFNIRNKTKHSITHLFAADSIYASCKDTMEPYGWLVDLINRFGELGGFTEIRLRFTHGDRKSGPEMWALLQPFAKCAEFLNPHVVCPLLSPCMDVSVSFIRALSEEDMKSKTIYCICELSRALKLLCLYLWPHQVQLTNVLCLEVVLRMLQCPHFNAKMYGLKAVMKLIDDSMSFRSSKAAIDSEELLDWFTENKILTIVLEGNIDQVQYTDKIKGIIEFLGHKLSLDELTKIWKMQEGQNAQIIDNIHTIMTAASSKFNSEQFDHLLELVQNTWENSNDQMKKRIIIFIGRLGKDTNQGKTSMKILDLLWELSHYPALPVFVVEMALEEHFLILADVSHKDQTKKQFCQKCIEDIKKGTFVLPSLKLLHNICKSLLKSGTYKQDRAGLNELNKANDIIKLITGSLVRSHQQAVAAAKSGRLNPTVLVDGRYSHEDYLVEHLNYIQFILQDGAQYLPWNRARDIWDCLVSNAEACDFDKEICFEWFNKCLQDLETETQSNLFLQKLLQLDPAQLTSKGFNCFKTYFENVNTAEQKLRRSMSYLTVEKLELTGVGFLWQLALSSDESIADEAIHYLLEISYHALAAKLKKDMVSLHKRLINECYSRLERILATLGTTAMFTAVTSATKTLTAISVSEAAAISAPTKAASLLSICRILQVAERYISSIEEKHIGLRTILPHGTFFLGHPVFLRLYIESLKEEYVIISHSNESLGSIKHRIAQRFRQPFSKIHLLQDDIELPKDKNQCLISQFPFIDKQILTVKCPGGTISSFFTEVTPGPITDEERENFASFSIPSTSSSEGTSWTSHHLFLLEQEKQLPGVVMASGGQAFEMLYQLAGHEEPNITAQVRRLLHLIPTDPSTLDALDSIGVKKITELPSPSEASRGSPRFSPKKFTVNSPLKEKIESPKEILKNLFDISNQLSPFKLLYSLEVLSGKLMPVTQDAGMIQSADIFRSNFLTAGGLKLILGILQKDSICNEIDYNIRQSCYMAALTIARYLLCDQTGLEIDSVSSLPCHLNTMKSHIIGFPIHYTAPSASCSEIEIHSGRKAIDELNQTELLDTLSSLMRIAWAAAAGNLSLANSYLPSKEGHFYGGRRSRQSSSGSNASSGSESCDGVSLHGGVCGQQPFVSPMDSLLSQKALKFLVLSIKLRPDIFCAFSKLQCNKDFVIDVLLGSPSRNVRYCAMEQFYNLSQLHGLCNPSPKHYMLQNLIKAHLPLWVSSSSIRGANQKLLDQCKEYFELSCKLLDGLTEEEQTSLEIDAKHMVEEEINWLQGFSPSTMTFLHSADSALMTGHFKFVKTLLRCEGVSKEDVGRILVPDLLQNFLFPASHQMSAGTASTTSSSVTPKCLTLESRVAAYDVLVELSTGCSENLEKIVKQLLSTHHYVKPELAKEFDYEPLVAERAASGYVGLKNAGATCYMNSVIQQLYMQPGLKESILSLDEDNSDEDSLFYQLQMMFGHLLESRLQYHTPENFWKCFLMWGEPINVREQQDTFEFFTHLIDQIDEEMKKRKWDLIFKQKYEGTFSDQKICHGCPHRYEREETFMALNLPIKSHNLLDSLDQFVKGELLEGQNAYFCEKCQDKRNAIKRMCIKTLPPVLVIQLKRFDYDWEANRAIKFDDYFKFPWQLDMGPYTTEGMQEKETIKRDDENQVVPSWPSSPPVMKKSIGNTVYELVGVIVHSGQANAGHYYSYIKERRLDSGTNMGKWFKFNDTTVSECEMNDATLEAECFGGTYKAKVKDSSSSYPETRQRYWNAYLLFYEKAEDAVRTPRTPRKTPNKFSFRKSENDVTATVSRNLFRQSSSGPPGPDSTVHRHRDSLRQLTKLVDRGERHGLFLDKMPARIQQVVREENLRFMHNRDIYNDSYFTFVQRLVSVNVDHIDRDFGTRSVNSLLPLSVSFLFNTYFRYKNKDSHLMTTWTNTIETIICCCKEASFWFIDFLASDIGLSYMKPFLLECPNREVRQVFSRLLEKGISTFFFHGGETNSSSLDHIIVHLLDLLSQDVPDNCKSCNQYFSLLCTYAQLGSKTCAHMLANNAFYKFLVFLLGPAAADMQTEEAFPRRWNTVQTQDFGSLHATMAFLVLHCDLVPHRTCEPGSFTELQSIWVNDAVVVMPDEVKVALYGLGAFRYIQEVVCACREASGSISVFVDMLVQCSFCNEIFSSLVISQVMLQYSCVPSNELTHLLYLMLELVMIEDPLQFLRVRLVIDGSPQDQQPAFDGILSLIRTNQASDSRRSYQGVKFLVSLAHKCVVAKEYLMKTPNKWQWSVNWLKKKMTEHSYLISTTNASISNEDSNTKNFQRTTSAQDTLDEATALLIGVDSPESPEATMDVDDDDEEEEERTDMPVETIIPIQQEVPTDEDARRLKRVQGMDDLDSIDD